MVAHVNWIRYSATLTLNIFIFEIILKGNFDKPPLNNILFRDDYQNRR
jgi:hypothetical protein